MLQIFNLNLASSLSAIRKHTVDFNPFGFCEVSFLALSEAHRGDGHRERVCILLFVGGWRVLQISLRSSGLMMLLSSSVSSLSLRQLLPVA